VNPWTSLAMIKTKTEVTLGATKITPKGKQFELGTEVYPSQIDGDTTANFWLPSYFTQWTGRSLVLPDSEAAILFKNRPGRRGAAKFIRSCRDRRSWVIL